MSKVVFTPVYRRKAQGDKRPRLGLPDSIRPGDYLTVYINGACHTRRCMSIHKGHVLTEPLRWNGQTLDSSRKILWEDIEDASRPPEDYQEPVTDTLRPRPQPPEPPPPKKPDPLKGEPAPPSAPPPEVTPKPPKKPKAPEPPKKPKAPEPPPPAKPALPNDLTDLWALLSTE